MSRLSLTAVALAVGLAGCASTPTPLTQQEIQAATQSGNLEELYTRLAARVAQAEKLDSRDGERSLEQLQGIGNRLATRLEQDIRQGLGQHPLDDGLVPLPVVEAQLARLPKMEKWAPDKHRLLAEELNGLKERVLARISEGQERLAQLDANSLDDAGARVEVLASLAKVTGDNRYLREREAVLKGLREQADTALKKKRYDKARQVLAALQPITPDDASLAPKITLADAHLFEKQFWDSLTQGKPDEAYARFMELAQEERFPALLQHLSTSVTDMASYFTAQAGTALSENRLGDAYQRLSQARSLAAAAKLQLAVSPQEDAFLKAVNERYLAALESGQAGLALGYLKVMERFNPDYPGLRDGLRAAQEAALARATRTLSPAVFSDTTGKSALGSGTVAAKVTQYLADTIPHDIKIIASEERPAPQKGKAGKKGKDSSDAPAVPATADYVIEGKILESRIDTTEDHSKKTMRVVTGTTTVPNPAYEQWLALPEEQRATLPEPPRTVSQEKTEEVTVNLKALRKVGIVAVTYRLIEARTGRVLATGSELAKEEITDEGNDGVELGDYHLPVKLATLPTDAEILQKLSEKISSVVGEKLAQELKDPELRYTADAKRYLDEGNAALAAEHEAYAFTLATLKGQDVATHSKTLEQYAVKTF